MLNKPAPQLGAGAGESVTGTARHLPKLWAAPAPMSGRDSV